MLSLSLCRSRGNSSVAVKVHRCFSSKSPKEFSAMCALLPRFFSCEFSCRRRRNLHAVLVSALVALGIASPSAVGQAVSSSGGPSKASQSAAVSAIPMTQAKPEAGDAAPGKGAQTGKGSHEGISISGYWKIDVRHPDGSLATHVEFENAVTTGAAEYWLPTVLLGGPLSTRVPTHHGC